MPQTRPSLSLPSRPAAGPLIMQNELTPFRGVGMVAAVPARCRSACVGRGCRDRTPSLRLKASQHPQHHPETTHRATSPLDLFLQRRPVDFTRSSKLNTPTQMVSQEPEAARKLCKSFFPSPSQI